MTIAYYVSAHGFGHFVRSAAVIRALPAGAPMLLRTNAPPWFIEQELAGRRYSHSPVAFDCGTIGRDSSSVDPALTFRQAAEMLERNERRITDEVRFLKSNGIRVVITDMPSFPLRAARLAGIPSICETNFTWVEIYQHLANLARAAGETEVAAQGDRMLGRLREEYALGDLLLIPGMALPMEACAQQLEIPIIARAGREQRSKLCGLLGFNEKKPLVLLYLGQDGYAGLEWRNLSRISGAQFFAFGRIDGAPETVRILPQNSIDHADATASADAVVGKLGYSLCAECVATRRPLIFPPRPDFIEATALARSMVGFGLGIPLSADDFRAVNWESPLLLALDRSGATPSIPCTGAQICSEILMAAWRAGSLRDVRV